MAADRKTQLIALLADFPDDPFIKYGIAMEETSAGELENAGKRFEALIAEHPDYVPAYLQAGQLMGKLEQVDKARDIYTRGIAVARKQKDMKAAGEMEQFMDALD